MNSIFKFIKRNWVLILSFIYIISPIDALPEAILGPLGIIDDLATVLLMIVYSGFRFFKEEKKGIKEKVTGQEETVDIGQVKSKD